MRFEVKVQPGSKHEIIEKISDTQLKVKIKARALEGKANERLREVLGEFFHVPKSDVQILKGAKSKMKWVEIKIK